jgi:hypothetical protein
MLPFPAVGPEVVAGQHFELQFSGVLVSQLFTSALTSGGEKLDVDSFKVKCKLVSMVQVIYSYDRPMLC